MIINESSGNTVDAGTGAARPVTRRRFLQIGGAGLMAATMGPLLSACRPAASEVGGTIQYLGWEGYDLRDCMGEWEREHEVAFQASYIAEYPDIPTKLGSGNPSRYNLTTYYNGFAPLYIEDLELLEPLEKSKLPNWDNLAPFFHSGKWWSEGDQIWGVPWGFGVEGMNYLASEIDPPQSWMDLANPEFKDRIAIVDDNIGIYYIGAQILGLGDKVPDLSMEELDSILALYDDLRENARAIPYYGDLPQLFASGEIVACIPGWGAINVWANERNADVRMTIPREGAFSFIDAYAIPKGGDNTDTVHAWINESISPAVQPCVAASLAGGVVTLDAVEGLQELAPDVAALYDYDSLEELFRLAPVFDLPSREGDGPKYADWINKWNAWKAKSA